MILRFFSSSSSTHSLLSDRAPEAAGITASVRTVQVSEADVALGLVKIAGRDWLGWLRWVGW